ncbi:DUF4407 domain-containing protein [Sphaerisporangium sp. NPDC004334]
MLRRLIGVNEGIMDWVPEDRPKYTRTGAVVLFTAFMAALAAWVVLHEILSVPVAGSLAGALFWGALIAVFDSWLIASTHGVVGRYRIGLLLPRLAIAMLVGVVISEPVTLKVFESAIAEQISVARREADNAVINGYRRCYPEDADAPRPTGCDAYKLNVTTPRSVREALRKAEATQGAVAEQIDKTQTYLDGKKERADDECKGKFGPLLTGIKGEGISCRRDTQDWRNAVASHPLGDLVDHQERLAQEIDDLRGKLSTAKSTYQAEVREQINEQVRKVARAANPGVLERLEGLASLSGRHPVVFWAHWLLALLLLLIDCFPVLTKLISPPSAYDRRMALQLESKERLHDNDIRLTERVRTGDTEIAMHQKDLRVRHAMEDSDQEVRLHAAEREAELRARMDRLAETAKTARHP